MNRCLMRVAVGFGGVATAAAAIEAPRVTLREWITEHRRELDREREVVPAGRELAEKELAAREDEATVLAEGVWALSEGREE